MQEMKVAVYEDFKTRVVSQGIDALNATTTCATNVLFLDRRKRLVDCSSFQECMFLL